MSTSKNGDSGASIQGQKVSGELQATLLSEALPYMQQYEGKSIVVKYGGHAMGDAALGKAFARDIALLKNLVSTRLLCMAAARKLAPCSTKWGSKANLKQVFG